MRVHKSLYAVAALVVIAVLAVLYFNPFEKSEARTATVADWEWIDSQHGHCGIEYGGQLTKIGAAGSMVTVRYTPPTFDTGGTPCDGGDVFFIESQRFESITADYEAKKKFFAENKLAVDQLVTHPVGDPRTQVTFDLGFVEIEPVSAEGNQCVASDHGKLTEIGTIGSRVLVTYEPPAGLDIGQTGCDYETKFFVDASTFTSMTVRLEAAEEALAGREAVVNGLLANPVSNPRTHTVKAWQWVDIEPQTLERATCGLEEGNLLTEIGVHGTQVLVRYSAPRSVGAGTPCDGGEVFFVDAAQFQH